MELEDIIYEAVASNIDCSHLEVGGDGHHFELIAVSESFSNRSRLERHRMIYSALGDRMREQIHALSMKLYTKSEWQNG